LIGNSQNAMVAGDARANENIALTATHTLFAREHNRIVDLLPRWLSSEQKFQIARRIVIAEQQWITYHEWLPALGVRLSRYHGYNPFANPAITNEFATVGYRGHSMIHGEFEVEADADRYSAAQLDAFKKQGIGVGAEEDELKLTIPLNVAFFNPDLIPQLQLGPLLKGIGSESEYRNDEQIDNQLRSVLFQIPVAQNPGCLDGPTLPKCFSGVVDLAALDIERGRDHGMPSYNQLRRAYGLAPRRTFKAITGEASENWPTDPALGTSRQIDNPKSLDFVRLYDSNGDLVEPGTDEAQESVVRADRRTPVAARLKAIYGSPDKVDAFVGMVAEPHVAATEFGELQLAIWKKQFQALRDGDRFFYLSDPGLSALQRAFGIDYHRTLAEVIADNTDIDEGELRANVFRLDNGTAEPDAAPSAASTNGTQTPVPAVTSTPSAVVQRRQRRQATRIGGRNRG
jgi:Animal haem peroxidase